MSAPEASGTRQRTNKASVESETPNPTSLGTTSAKNVRRTKPKIDPPFWNMSMNRFLTYLTLSLLALLMFYTWRVTVWAKNAGGYWNLVTGRRVEVTPATGAGGAASAIKGAASAASAAGSAASAVGSKGAKGAIKAQKAGKANAAAGNPDVQSQIFTLATALGVTPHDLTAAIRPLIDPSVANPAEAAAKEIELLKLQLQGLGAGGAAAGSAAHPEETKEAEAAPGLLSLVTEAMLD